MLAAALAADSTYMMMSGRSLQPTAVRSPTIFYHIGGAFVAVNLLNALSAICTLAPLLLERSGGASSERPPSTSSEPGASGYFGDSGSARGSPNEPLVSFALWMSSLVAGCFSLLLAASSTVAGALVSCKIRYIADVEPALRSFAHQKMIKVALAACVFSTCALSRALVMLREAFTPEAPPLSPLAYLTFAVEVPELLPTLAALVVLRRRPITWCAPCWPCSGCGCAWLGRLGCCCACTEQQQRYAGVTGVDRTPLRAGGDGDV